MLTRLCTCRTPCGRIPLLRTENILHGHFGQLPHASGDDDCAAGDLSSAPAGRVTIRSDVHDVQGSPRPGQPLRQYGPEAPVPVAIARLVGIA